MTDSYQHEIPKSRVNISVDLHTGGARERVELPLKLMVMGDFSAGGECDPLLEREKLAIDRNNFDAVLARCDPRAQLAVANRLVDGGDDINVSLDIRAMKDFEPDAVAAQIPELQVLLAMRNLMRDLKANVLDNTTFRRELEKILKSKALSSDLRNDLARIATDRVATTP